jgi:hypothetical protein
MIGLRIYQFVYSLTVFEWVLGWVLCTAVSYGLFWFAIRRLNGGWFERSDHRIVLFASIFGPPSLGAALAMWTVPLADGFFACIEWLFGIRRVE